MEKKKLHKGEEKKARDAMRSEEAQSTPAGGEKGVEVKAKEAVAQKQQKGKK